MQYRFQSVLAVFLLLVLFQSCSREPKKENEVAARFYAVEAEPNYLADLTKRKVFPFSVVPGGTHNKEEVQAKVNADPVVREHYQGIDFSKLKPYRLTRPAMGYVSYRIGNKIFWTSQRMYLKPGEVLLSDGISVLRGRCGNRVSLVPMQPVRRHAEPIEAVLDLPSWDAPVFQAMVREANSLDGDLPLGMGDTPQTIVSLQRDLPDYFFPVAPAPGLTGPGSIGGGLPGGLTASGGEEPIIFAGQPPIVYISQTPIAPVPPFVLIPSITPVEITYNFPPSIFYPGIPTSPGSPTLFVDIPITPGFQVPIVFPPGITINPPQPPVVVNGPPPPPIDVNPPIVTPPPTTTPPGVNPPPTGSNPPPEILTPPETVPPPMDSIPEPGTLLLVPAAAALMIYCKRAAAAKAGS